MKASQLIKTTLGRSYLREVAGCHRNAEIVMVEGKSPPVVKGQSWHYETKGGRMIYHPSSYSKSGWSNMVYIPSSIRVEVGRNWKANIEKDFDSKVSILRELLSDLGIVTVFNHESYTYDIISDDSKYCYWDLPLSKYRKIAKRIINCTTFL